MTLFCCVRWRPWQYFRMCEAARSLGMSVSQFIRYCCMKQVELLMQQ